MSWSSTSPDGTKSVKANETIIQGNTIYTETKMQLDHYWAEDANNDGHHRKVEMPDINASGLAVDANGDPTALSSGQNCMVYTRRKTATEQPGVLQSDEPFVYVIKDPLGTPVNQYMQVGFRAIGVFLGRLTNGACTISYSHNISSITRTGTGAYTVTFTKALPTGSYALYGSSTSGLVAPLLMYPTVKTAATCQISYVNLSGVGVDPSDGASITFCGG